MEKISASKGNTTLEVILSLIIFAFVMASVAIALPMASENTLGWRDRLNLSRYLERHLEEYRSLSYSSLSIGDTGMVSETLSNGTVYQYRRQISWVKEDTTSDSRPTWTEVAASEDSDHYPKKTRIVVANPNSGLSLSAFLLTFPSVFSTTVSHGLAGLYFNDLNFTGTTVCRLEEVNFDWGSEPPAPGIDAHTFSTRWTGYIVPKVSGNYTFYTTSDDGVRLWVNHQLLINNWNDHTSTENTASQQLYLQANQKYPVTMDYYENNGVATARLWWSGPSTPRQIIAGEFLVPTYSPSEDTCISRQNPNQVYGQSTDLDLNYSTGARRNSYLKFNITGITGRTITAVKLRLYSKKTGDTRFEVRKTTNDWFETAATWNNAPTVGNTVYGAYNQAVAAQTFIDIHLDPAVLDKGDGIYGLALIPTAGSTNLVFSSREDLNSDNDPQLDDHGPRLIIETSGSGEVDVPELAVLYQCRETASSTNTLRPWFKIVNQGTAPVDLSLLKIRYWYTADLTHLNQTFYCDWAGMEKGYAMNVITGFITHVFVPLNPELATADRYVEIGFGNGIQALDPGKSAELQNRIYNSSWQNYSQINDYSFNPVLTGYQPNPRITVYYNGKLIFGVEP